MNIKRILWFIFLFFFLSSKKMHVSAADITASAQTLNWLVNGVGDATNAGYIPFGYLPISLSGTKNYQPIASKLDVNVNDLLDVNLNDITLTPLSSEDYSIFKDPIYNSVGQPLDLQDLFLGFFDNGYFTSTFYTDSSGDLIYSDPEGKNPIMDIKHGGNIRTSQDWIDAYYNLESDIIANNYFYSNDGEPVTNNWYYLFFGQTDGTNPTHAYSLYVFNQYIPGNTVPIDTYQASRIYRWLTNDLSNFCYNDFIGNDQNVFQVSTVNRYYNGYTYKYQITYFEGRDFSSYPANNTYENWLAGINRQNDVFARNGYFYTPSRLTSNQVAYKPLDMDITKGKINIGSSYGVGALDDYVDVVSNTVPIPNKDFDFSQSFGTTNYPLIFNISVSVPVSVIPEVIVADPAITYPLDQEIDPSLITPNIPIISDLKNKFPFSIPWDIAAILKGFETERETPYINTDVVIPGINYTWHIEYDLSAFDSIASLFRTLFLIGFVIGLAYFSYEHFFGS